MGPLPETPAKLNTAMISRAMRGQMSISKSQSVFHLAERGEGTILRLALLTLACEVGPPCEAEMNA